MNTQSHVLISLFAVNKLAKKKIKGLTFWAIFGGLLPDLPIFFFVLFYAFVPGITEAYLWETLFFLPEWKLLFSIFNSIPLFLILLGIGLMFKKYLLSIFSFSALLHVVGDFFTHAVDGHSHLFPFTTYVFHSPVSYWDAARFGVAYGIVEFVVLLYMSWYLFKIYPHWVARGLIIFALLLSVLSIVGTILWF